VNFPQQQHNDMIKFVSDGAEENYEPEEQAYEKYDKTIQKKKLRKKLEIKRKLIEKKIKKGLSEIPRMRIISVSRIPSYFNKNKSTFKSKPVVLEQDYLKKSKMSSISFLNQEN